MPSLTDQGIADRQSQASGQTDQSKAITLALQKTPAYQDWVASMKQPNVSIRKQAADALQAEGDKIGIPNDLIFDPSEGVVRGKDWNERNSNWSALMYTGAAIGAGLTAGAATAALAPAVGAVAGGGAATTAATVPAALASVGGTAAATAGGAGLTGTIANALISKGVPAIASTLGGAAKAGQAQNNTDSQLALQQGQLQQGANKLALEAPNTRLATAIKASLASNYTPQQTTWAGPGSGLKGLKPTITGGLAGGLANLDPRVKDLANQVMIDELTGQQQGGPSGGNQDRTVPQVGQSSAGDKLLGGASLGTSILGSLLPSLLKKGTSTPSPSNPMATSATPGGGFVGPPDPGPQVGGLTEDEIYQMMQQGEGG